jgi:Tfp pilus assembly protein FimT
MYTQSGRSMVEMLGVLAIIGVLSVGAIAGYSKAMMKYKLNKHAEQMNTVINAVARNAHSFSDLSAATSLVNILIKMGEIPVEMIKPGDTNNIYDIFGQTWIIFISSSNDTIFLQTDSSSSPSLRNSSADNLAICQNIFTTAKENAANLYYINTISNYGNENGILKLWLGDKYCGKSEECLRNMSLDNIYDACTAHKGVSQPIMYQMTWTKNR